MFHNQRIIFLFFQFRETILPPKLNVIISHFEKQSDHDNFGNSPKSEVLIEAINPLFQLSEPYDEMCGSRCLFKNHDTFPF